MTAADVVVIGAGPVGLFAALRLAQAGVDVVVLERQSGLGQESRASTFHAATLELLDAAGVVDQFMPRGMVIDELQWRDLDGLILARLPFSMLAGRTRFTFRLHAEQTALTPILAAAMSALRPGALRFGAEALSLSQDEHGVSLEIAGGSRVTARYALVADGSASRIRQQLGIEFVGSTYGSRAVRVITHEDLPGWLPDLSGMSYVRDERGSASILGMPDHWRLIFRVRDQESSAALLRLESVRALVDNIVPALPIEDAHTYGNRHHVADAFRCGRALLAGDAAHVTTTAGGMNMNAGLHDAFDMAASLADAIAAGAPPEALDEVAERRRLVITDVIVARTEARAAGADGQTDALRSFVAGIRATAADPERASQYLAEASMLDTRPVLDTPSGP